MFKIHLRKILFDREMKQADLKKLTGIRDGTLSAYYHGYAKRLNVKDLEKICKALDCKIEELIEYIPDKE